MKPAQLRQNWTDQKIVVPLLVSVVNPPEMNEYDIEEAIHIGHILWYCRTKAEHSGMN
jgi:hypothetical protein